MPLKILTGPGHFKKYYGAVILSVLLGAASHLFWDSFTNKKGFFIHQIPFLTDYSRVLKKAIPHFVLAHYISSVAGGLIVSWAILKLPAPAAIKPRPINIKYWLTMLIIAGLLGVMRLLFQGVIVPATSNIILAGISAGLVSLMITSFIFRKEYK